MTKEKKGASKQRPFADEERSLEEPSGISTSSCSHPVPQPPKTSPYTSFPVVLRIGPEQRVYYVPRNCLQSPRWIASITSAPVPSSAFSSVNFSYSWRENIYLPDVDENTGHTLVHYLYTGAYQTLDNTEASLVEGAKLEFKRAFLAYIAAKTYDLRDLQQLAKHKIKHIGTRIHVFDIIEAIKEDFSKLPSDTTWFYNYLDGKAKTALEEDHTAFAKGDIFSCIDDIALCRLLAKCVVGLYNTKLSGMLNTEGAPVPGICEEYIAIPPNSLIEACPAEELPAKEIPIKDVHVGEALIEEPMPEPVPDPKNTKDEENQELLSISNQNAGVEAKRLSARKKKGRKARKSMTTGRKSGAGQKEKKFEEVDVAIDYADEGGYEIVDYA
ncbi:hypothetical protein BCR34DRAFT_668121 [Clohesyomyces aquaticus]|uniref:BTB domain-containing protein n=1 Tax=Clohesyomyces aquaticus TaxID=1231657 RepID=A0A1Y1YSL3_9PLEO|nr:hypothetical protein BCR34DRAFT_668121 [Clohesyomyces aquaticus]